LEPKSIAMPEPATAPRRKLTVEEFEALPLPRPEGVRYELLDGEVVVVEGAPAFDHQAIQANLILLLGRYLQDRKRGAILAQPTGTVLGRHTIVLPDLLVVLNENRAICREDGIYGPPDLVIEIVSPGSATRDFHTKREIYGAQGVREYWVVDPKARSILQLMLDRDAWRTVGLHQGDAVFRPVVLPDLEVPLAAVFRPAFPDA
jgi:Uma2 family endonuclease